MSRNDDCREWEFEGTILSALCVVALAISIDLAIPSHPDLAQETTIAMAFALATG